MTAEQETPGREGPTGQALLLGLGSAYANSVSQALLALGYAVDRRASEANPPDADLLVIDWSALVQNSALQPGMAAVGAVLEAQDRLTRSYAAKHQGKSAGHQGESSAGLLIHLLPSDQAGDRAGQGRRALALAPLIGAFEASLRSLALETAPALRINLLLLDPFIEDAERRSAALESLAAAVCLCAKTPSMTGQVLRLHDSSVSNWANPQHYETLINQ